MSVKAASIIGICIVVAVVSHAFIVRRAPLACQVQQAPSPPEPGRQSTVVGRFEIAGIPGLKGHAYVLDTATGRVWEKEATESGGGRELDFGSVKVEVKPAP